MDINSIFNIQNISDFENITLEIFRYQSAKNPVYSEFIKHLDIDISAINSLDSIPFLPIELFKSHEIKSTNATTEAVFLSSGTTGQAQSKHYITDLSVYEKSYSKGFNLCYGPISDYVVLALLPSYLEREGSSLIYMANDFITKSNHEKSGFYLNDYDSFSKTLEEVDAAGKKVLLIGVSFALLDVVERFEYNLKNTIVMETGGMKGRRKELIREELHAMLCEGFGVDKIHSEYGMTELLSQAYSTGFGRFNCPPWMRVMARDTEDPFSKVPFGKSGGLNIIDLANINSCSFIATKDLGRVYEDGTFEVLGRFDHSDVRGCNLMVM